MKSQPYREAVFANVCALIRKERTKKGLSLNMLAQLSGLSRQMVSYIEQQERNPSLDTLLRISEALKIPLDKLVNRAQNAAKRRR